MTNTQQIIYDKLEAFIRKYHFSELVRGALFFTGVGVLYFIVVLFVEYFLWLPSTARLILFTAFITVELALFVRYILLPLSRLFRIRKGLSYEKASHIIGDHFSEVSDTLINFLQLSSQEDNGANRDLIMASINQKASALELVPFSKGVTFKGAVKYIPVASIALLLWLYLLFVPQEPLLSESYKRIVQYDQHFTPPAPFSFEVENKTFKVLQGEDFILRFSTKGELLPEKCEVILNGNSFYANRIDTNQYEYVFRNMQQSQSVVLKANKVKSIPFLIEVIDIPAIQNFEMELHYPKYLNKASEIVKGSGNVTVPEGTEIKWNIAAKAATTLVWESSNKRVEFIQSGNCFGYSQRLNESLNYNIITSNENVKEYEKLSYSIEVVKDNYPVIKCEYLPDSLQKANDYVYGEVSDDRGILDLEVVYYNVSQPDNIQSNHLKIQKGLYDTFSFSLNQVENLGEGITYEYYFLVRDNDQLNGYKSTRSKVFSYNAKTQTEIAQENLEQQSKNIDALEESLKQQKDQLRDLNRLERDSKEKRQFNYNEQQKVKEFLEKQQKEEQMMKAFSKKLEENLEQFNKEQSDKEKDELLDRLKKNQEELGNNQKLIDEINKLNDKIKQEELTKSLEKLKKSTKNQAKSLEQLLELTKRFYVEKKMEMAAAALDNLSKKQNELSEKNLEDKSTEQEKINKKFNDIKEELKELNSENESLKSPMDIPQEEALQQSIEEDLDKALEKTKEGQNSKAKPSQKSASDKMKEMGDKLSSAMQDGAMEQLEEDVEMLRQIMDNLLTFSFSQEKLLDEFTAMESGAPSFPKRLKEQHFLVEQFRHIDDSLYALSLRNPVITDVIIKEIGEVYYNSDKAIEEFTESRMSSGIAHQQYVMSATNVLSNLLSDALNSMQMDLSSSGQGKPQSGQGKGGKQLSDIIKSQEGLAEKMQEGQKGKGNKPGESKGEGQTGNGEEGMSNEVFEIYKEQQSLRESLEGLLKKEGINGNGGNAAVDRMKALEKQLLNKGVTHSTIQQVNDIKQDLLKLDNAIRKEGESKQRKATTNQEDFTNTNTKELPDSIKQYLDNIEVLNRHILPLQDNINIKVKQYFDK